MGTIWLLRHGETEWSRSDRHTGLTDVPLTEQGQRDADGLAARVAPIRAGLVLCSPLSRARETAHRAGLVPDATTDDLVEWDYGAWEGRTTSEIRQQLGDPTWVVWDHPIPAGVSPGEQLSDVAARVERVITRCEPMLVQDRDCILIAHGHVLRILTARWLALPANAGRLFALAPARLSSLGFEHDQRVITSWNATST
jgi:broad specificity phosphatase PhoE